MPRPCGIPPWVYLKAGATGDGRGDAAEGAVRVGGWDDDGAGGMPSRSVLWTENDGSVAVDGAKWADGSADAAVSVCSGDGAQFDATQARELAAALLEAADGLDAVPLRLPA